jgi:hypothetical protein
MQCTSALYQRAPRWYGRNSQERYVASSLLIGVLGCSCASPSSPMLCNIVNLFLNALGPDFAISWTTLKVDATVPHSTDIAMRVAFARAALPSRLFTVMLTRLVAVVRPLTATVIHTGSMMKIWFCRSCERQMQHAIVLQNCFADYQLMFLAVRPPQPRLVFSVRQTRWLSSDRYCLLAMSDTYDPGGKVIHLLHIPSQAIGTRSITLAITSLITPNILR